MNYTPSDKTFTGKFKCRIGNLNNIFCLILFVVLYFILATNTIDFSLVQIKDNPPRYAVRNLRTDDGGISRSNISQVDISKTIGVSQTLPHAIIIGVKKCGTTALITYLSLHRSISVAEREVHFFDNDERYSRGLDWYRKEMPSSLPWQLTIEKTPKYFIKEEAPMRIRSMNRNIKLIVTLRNPVTRLISDYTVMKRIPKRKLQNTTFEEFVMDKNFNINVGLEAVRTGMYHLHFKRWLSLFKMDQIHIVDGENLIVRPIEEIRKVERFLGLENEIKESNVYFNKTKGFYCIYKGTRKSCLKKHKGRKHPVINETVLTKLKQWYQYHNKLLYDLIDRSFNWD